MEIESLPNEVLEKVFRYVTDEESLFSCRMVSRRWNHVAVRFWRQLNSSRAQLPSTALMEKFIEDMDNRFQDFPFSRVRFKDVNPETIEAVINVLRESSGYITDVDVSHFMVDENEEDDSYDGKEELKILLECLDVSVLPNLEELRFGSFKWPVLAPLPSVNLSSLQILRLPNSSIAPWKSPTPAALIALAPNLHLLETQFILYAQQAIPVEPHWPFLDEHKRINVIELSLKITFFGAGREALADFVKKLEEWKNIRVVELSVDIAIITPGEVPQLRLLTQTILDLHSTHIRKLVLVAWPSTFTEILKLPKLPNIVDLKINFGYNREMVQPIVGTHFPKLTTVTLASFTDPAIVFQSAVLDSVKTFCVHYPQGTGQSDSYTKWGTVFPNLQNFTYINPYLEANHIYLGYVGHLVSELQMQTLENVAFKIFNPTGSTGAYDTPWHRTLRSTYGNKEQVFTRALSGFSVDLEELVGAGAAGFESAVGGESARQMYWTDLERNRRPCLATMIGLKTFFYDDVVDDNFAQVVLLRLKSLDRLSICTSQVQMSQDVLSQLTSHHKELCSISPTEYSRIRLPGEEFDSIT